MTDVQGGPTAAGEMARTDRRRLVGRSLVALVLVVVAVVLIGPRGQQGVPLDPRSTGPLGTRGILEVMDRLGVPATVEGGVPGPDDGVVLLIADDLTDAQHEALGSWVDEGGRLVLTDPLSVLAPDVVGLTSIAFTEPTIEPACDDPMVAGVDRVAVAGASVMAPGPGASACFPRNGGHWMVRTPTGAGEVITLGGAFTLTNELLGQADTAVLLANLLTPDRGGLRVLRPDRPPGDATLTDLLPDQVGLALLQLPLAWLALVWWRARRHGQPVPEASPVRVEAAETTIAVGNLLQRADRVVDAAAIVRAHVRRELTRRLGLSDAVTADPQVLVEVVASRTDLDPATLTRLLAGPLPTDDDGLVRFTAAAVRTVGNTRQRRSADPLDGSTSPSPSSTPHVEPSGARSRE